MKNKRIRHLVKASFLFWNVFIEDTRKHYKQEQRGYLVPTQIWFCKSDQINEVGLFEISTYLGNSLGWPSRYFHCACRLLTFRKRKEDTPKDFLLLSDLFCFVLYYCVSSFPLEKWSRYTDLIHISVFYEFRTVFPNEIPKILYLTL